MTEELRELAIRALIVCVSVTWLVILWRADKNPELPNFSFRALISTRDGYPDRVAIMELGSWIAFTVVLVVLTLRDRLTEWFCGIYVFAFVVRGAHAAYLKATNPPEPGKITTTMASSTRTQTVEGPKLPEGPAPS